MRNLILLGMLLLGPSRAPGYTGAQPVDPMLPIVGAVGILSDDKIRLNLINAIRPEGSPNLPCMVQTSLAQAHCPPPPPLAPDTLTLNLGQSGALPLC